MASGPRRFHAADSRLRYDVRLWRDKTIAELTFMIIDLLSDRWPCLTLGILHRMFPGIMTVSV